MTVKMYCDGPDCEVIALVGDPEWWLVQQLRETFHFHAMPCLDRWATHSVAMLAMQRGAASVGSGVGGSPPWHLRGGDRRGDDCPRCGTLVVTEPVPGT